MAIESNLNRIERWEVCLKMAVADELDDGIEEGWMEESHQ